ncbi:uncharacterized protein LOC110449447 [Mizuhopecten yessoensis]|uniref:uncharacterized protein LOC110449447 n=1 Tax=Mizuhopecten yessoensis TaxID=6573 RepID=UPI000B45AF67|nr:uncharacterized protein LOC110449447 [Mizuhopecten yessoensis]XP_021351998.1 uncharacterized protein LOC110449447 [Mizuhopecten yessoensis]XP_021351999.1 uncharacterized protein LOC110449447 [Mizuhopecten yessoensis]XP_021352000.1 uncharacterized protein LOC110449447 [Mizuhopecten yessoensis]
MADDRDDEGGCTPESNIKTRGRVRICKSCKFTCTDSKEFLNHQVYAHSQDGDPDLLASLGSRRKSQSSMNNHHTKKTLTRSSSSSDTVVSPSEKLLTHRGERFPHSSLEVTSPLEKTSNPDGEHFKEKLDNFISNDIETSDSMSDIQEVGLDRNTANEKTVDAEYTSDLEMDMDMDDKVTEQTYILNPEGDDQDEEGRLIIAEDEPKHSNHVVTQPTRSGNIQNRTYVCNLCEFSSTSAKIFLHHQKDSHSLDITIYECDICEYATKYKQKLPRHRKLHFTGKENGGMMSGSDLDSSFGEKSFHTEDRDMEIREHMLGEEEEEEEVYDEEEEEEETVVPVAPDNNICEIVQGEKKKRKTRQEVDPAKYFEVLDETGVKYACSKCGNVYKWRKSLNKHWKEKHFGDLPDTGRPPTGLVKLNTISHVKYRVPSSYENNGRMSVSPSVGSHKGGRSNTATPQSLHGYPIHSEPREDMPMPSASSVVMPKFIGPFITNTTSYPANKGPGHAIMEALQGDKVRRSPQTGGQDENRASSGPRQREQPLDFSVKKELDVNRNISHSVESYTKIKSEPQWNEYMEENGNDSNMPNKMRLPLAIQKQESVPILQCSRCGFVAKTLVDYSSHMTLHLNKRAFKCAECQEHFNGVDELNKHFAEEHSDKIHEHKEAIQKIPHGLQQTYHLLKMPLNAIGSMSSQEIGNGEPKFLKCSMCSFVAKWPAELQKHAVSHSEERPFVCMVCGSTYKWKWDLVKHFEKSHSTLPNPYKRREQGGGGGSVSGNSSKPGIETSPPLSSSERSSETPNSISSLYEISSGQVLSSTTAALLDAGSHNIRKIPFTHMQGDIEPAKKKRRLSDTDLPLQNGQNDNSHVRYIMSGGMDGASQERPSSEPLSSLNKEDSQDAFMRKHLHLNSVRSNSALKDIHDLIPGEEEDFQDEFRSRFGFNSTMSMSNETNTMLEIMKKRLEAGTLSPSEKCKLTMDKSGKVTPSDILLPYRCPRCEYRARWPSEITQHMKNHSDEKPYHCPRCSYKSKWKWDVVKHLKRCGGGTIRDVIDTSKIKKMPPPNVTVMPQGNLQQQTPQPVNYIMNSSLEDSKEEEDSLPNGVAKQAMAYYKNYDMAAQYQDYEEDFSQDESSDNQPRQPVFRSLINQGMYHCLECPFIGHSPAELRRHAVLHSENKPFTCTICGYSSRWKCDLKKHIRTYEHFDVNASNKHKAQQEYTTPMYLQDKFKLSKPSFEQEDDDDEDRTLYRCDSCQYVTYKKSSYDIHVKMHGDTKKEDGGSSAKLRCKQCEFQAEDLSSFLQHKKSHSAAVPSQGQPPEQVSNRTLHLKHRRKPVQQFKCSKCPYTCFKRSGLSLHEAMHEPRGGEAFICLYCDYNVYSKNLVLQHMRLHPEFDAQECQDFLKDDDMSDFSEDFASRNRDDDNEDCLVIDDMEQEDMEREYMEKFSNRSGKLSEKSTNFSSGQDEISQGNQNEGLDLSAGALDLTSMSQTSATNPQPTSIFGRGNPNNRFPCEWCSAMFPNVVTVYQHARTAHPFELRAQELGETMSLPTKTPASNAMSAFSAKVEKQQNLFGGHSQSQQASSVQAHTQAPATQQHAPRQLHSRLFNQTFVQQPRYRPIEPKPHQQQQQLQQPNIQNIPKPTVPVTSIIPKPTVPVTLNQSVLHQRLQEISNKVAMSGPSASSVTPSQPRSLPSSLPSTPSPQQRAQQHMLQQLKAKKSTSPHKRGRSFQCTKCSFTAPNAVTYLRHIERHGSNCRHTCRFCDYSIDRLNLLYQHMKGTHSDLWRGTPEEKINLTSNGTRQDSRQKMYQSMDHSFDSMHNGFEGVMDEFGDMKGSGGDDSLNSSMTSTDFSMMASKEENKPVMVLKEETTWRGIPVQVCTINGRKNYKCPKCSYVSSNAANTTNHVRQHGSNRKYKCEQCDYSVDNLKLIYHHMQSVHPSEPNFLEKSGGKLPFTVEYEYLPEENNNSLTWGEEGFSNRNNRTSTVQLAGCTKCPFKTNSLESIQQHQDRHEYKGQLSCQYCDYSVDSQTELVKHLIVHREPYEPEILEDFEDDANSEEYNMYREHQKRQQQKASKANMESDMEIEAMVPTHKLTQQFLKNIVNRMKKNGERLRYKCARCPYFSFCKNNIIKHRRQHLVKSQYACQMCDYSATRAFLLTQHMKFHKEEEEEMVKAQEGTPKTGGTFQDVILDPFDKEGCNLLKNIEALDNKITERTSLSQEEQKDFEDEALDEMEFGPRDENIEDFDEEEMAALERAEFEGINNSKMESSLVKDDSAKEGQDVETVSNASDDSLSEIDPSALQEQISLNMSATVTNGEKIRYNCSLCPYKCNALRSFKCHIHMHGLNKKYICDFCNWSADRLNLLYQHRKVHIEEQGFVLNQEDIVFLNRDFALESNDKIANNIMEMIPPLRIVNNNNNNTVPQELEKNDPRRMFNRNFSGKKVYTCKQCPFTCNNKNSFDYHKNLHRIKARYQCSECSYSVDRWNLLSQHMRLHAETDSFGRGQNRCPKCPYLNPNSQLLEVHLQLHGAGKEFACKFCDYSVDKQSSLQQHQKVHLTDESGCSSPLLNQMDMKNFETSSPDRIAPQLYFNSPENDIDSDDDSLGDAADDLKCERCPYGTPSKDELADHEHQHNIHYKYACPYCDYSCPEEFQLVDHIQLHLPSTKVDRDVVKSILEKQSKNGDKSLERPEVPVVSFRKVHDTETAGEPDSTTTSPPGQLGEKKMMLTDDADKMKAPKEKNRTKVYVCQYCEREFEGKNLMLQHERQHLIGTKY